MTTAQVIFVIALSVVALIITAFAIYVVGTTLWADRWVKAKPAKKSGDSE